MGRAAGGPAAAADNGSRSTYAQTHRKVKGVHEQFVHVTRTAKERKARTATRTRSLKEARELQRGAFSAVQDLSPTALYLTLLGGIAFLAACTYWVVVISTPVAAQ